MAKSTGHKKGSGVDVGLRALIRERGAGWTYNSKTRGFVNEKTGEKISRRQFDKNYGLLKQQGVTSFEQKVKTRKAAGLSGFKMMSKHHKVQTKTYNSRAEMLAAFEQLKGNKTHLFRVIIRGEPADDKYKPDSKDGETSIYSRQLAPMSPEDTLATYGPDAESKLKKVSKWTIVALPIPESNPQPARKSSPRRKDKNPRNNI